MVIPYAAVNKDGTWRGVGDRILPGKQLVCFFEENIKRGWHANQRKSPIKR
jgi:hypothetical protein